MLTQIINGKIFTPQGWLDEGSVLREKVMAFLRKF